MRITKIIETGLNIPSPIDVYSEAESNILDMVTGIYEGKCYRNCRIEKVLRIVNISECIIVNRGDYAGGTVNVQFEVEATVYYRGEVITGCVVKHKNQGLIVAQHETASIFIQSHEQLASIQVDQIIPVVVGEATYNIQQELISINAVPYVPNRSSINYKLEGTLNDSDKKFLELAIGRMETEEKLTSEVKNKKGLQFFKDRVYPYREPQKTPKGATSEDLKKLIKQTEFSGWYCRDKRILPTDPIVYKYDGPVDDPDITNNATADIRHALLALIEDYTNNLRVVRELNDTYPPEIVGKHKNLWRIFHHAASL